MFFDEAKDKKNKHKNRKAIWFEYLNGKHGRLPKKQ